MRGHYYSDTDRIAQREADAQQRAIDPFYLPKVDDNRPQAVVSPETPSSPADLRAVVRYAAFNLLRSELGWDEATLRAKLPALVGITTEQIAIVLAEELA